MNDIKKTIRNQMTRIKIGETIIHLLDRFSLSEIRVVTIAKLAGISRMTFYHYYDSIENALKDYLSEIIHLYHEELHKLGLQKKFLTAEHLEFTFSYFAKYDKLLLKLEAIGCYRYIIESVNHYIETEYRSYFKNSIYPIYFYSGGVLNVFMAWLHDNKSDSPRALAKNVRSLCSVI